MSGKARFQLSIIGLTIVLIGSLSGAFISGMFLFIEVVEAGRVIIMVLCLGLGAWALLKMIELNRKEIDVRVDAVINDYHEFIDKWTIESGQWKQFLQARLDYDRKESNGYGFTIGGVLTFLIAVIGFSNFDIQVMVPVLIVSFPFFFMLGKWGSMLGARRRFEKQLAFREGEVCFAEKLIVLNGHLIMLEDFGVRLKFFEVQMCFHMVVLSFKVETGYGNRKSHSLFFIPIPNEKQADGERLVSHYSALIG